VHRRTQQIDGHLRPAQPCREREPERREQLGELVGRDHDRYTMLVASRLTLAQPHPPALTIPDHGDELVPGRPAPGLQIRHDRRERIGLQLDLVTELEPGQPLADRPRDRGRDRQPANVQFAVRSFAQLALRHRRLTSPRDCLGTHAQPPPSEGRIEHRAAPRQGHRG
jgi:hypothetical protein